MGELAFKLNVWFEPLTCCHEGCGLVFAVPAWFETKRREDRARFFCPNGHGQSFTTSEADRLRAEIKARDRIIDAERQATQFANRRLDSERRSHAATKGKVTKIRNRIAAGVCPCCNRTFTNLARHMKGQHPDFTKETSK